MVKGLGFGIEFAFIICIKDVTIVYLKGINPLM